MSGVGNLPIIFGEIAAPGSICCHERSSPNLFPKSSDIVYGAALPETPRVAMRCAFTGVSPTPNVAFGMSGKRRGKVCKARGTVGNLCCITAIGCPIRIKAVRILIEEARLEDLGVLLFCSFTELRLSDKLSILAGL